jgi:hypothetical protein
LIASDGVALPDVLIILAPNTVFKKLVATPVPIVPKILPIIIFILWKIV